MRNNRDCPALQQWGECRWKHEFDKLLFSKETRKLYTGTSDEMARNQKPLRLYKS